MIVVNYARGGSFKGLANYLLHDKGEKHAPHLTTSNRVEFTETLNLPTADARRAVAHMIDTANHADDLKRAAGVETRGRKSDGKSVFHTVLSWAPDEAPSDEQMRAAARAYLKRQKMDGHQVVMVAHNDEKQRHLHMMVNLIDPSNGRKHTLSYSHTKGQSFALEYEQWQGQIRCKMRVVNKKAREQNAIKRANGEKPQKIYYKDKPQTEIRAWKEAESSRIWAKYRQDRDNARDEYKRRSDELWKRRAKTMARYKGEIREQFRPQWRDFYKERRANLAQFEQSFARRLNVALKTRRGSRFKAIAEAVTERGSVRLRYVAQLDAQRVDLRDRQRAAVRVVSQRLYEGYKAAHTEMRTAHKAQQTARLNRARDVSTDIWKRPTLPPPAPKPPQAVDEPQATQQSAIAAEEAPTERIREQRQSATMKSEFAEASSATRRRSETDSGDRGDTGAAAAGGRGARPAPTQAKEERQAPEAPPVADTEQQDVAWTVRRRPRSKTRKNRKPRGKGGIKLTPP